MRRKLVRVAMAVVGALSLGFYAAAASLVYLLLRAAWADRPSAVGLVLLLAGVTLLLGYGSYRFGTERLLAAIQTSELARTEEPWVFDRIESLCAAMDLDRPRVLTADLGEPNAFAMSSPRGGVVVLDRSLLDLLSDDEVVAILAHELAHLERHDSLVQLFAFTGLQTAMQVVSVALLPAMLLLTGLAKAHAWFSGRPTAWTRTLAWRVRTVVVAVATVVPALCTFVILARSRRREYAADRRAAEVTGDPLALASALRTVHETAMTELRLRGLLPTEEERAAMAGDPLARLLASHPDLESRIARLEAMAERETEPGS